MHDLNKAIELNPNNEKAFFERAFLKKNLNNLDGYKVDLQTAYEKGSLLAYHFLKNS